jgi:regulator of sigma E protease
LNYILAVLGLGAIIIIHELGHFVLAKINGVKVNSFTIGFGPKIITHKGKETEYALSILPVGGYVEMAGMVSEENIDEAEKEAEAEVEPERLFRNKSALQRLSIIIAGPIMNMVLALFLFTIVYNTFGFADTKLGNIMENSPASEVGLLPGDDIIKVNGNKIYTTEDISIEVSNAKDHELSMEIDRNGELFEIAVTPRFDEEQQAYLIGIGFSVVENPTFSESIKHSVDETFTMIIQNCKAITKLVTGKGSFKKDIGGPVAIVKMSSSAAKAGVWSLIKLVAMMSIGVGIFNFIPMPLLDGGRSLLLLIELITRRKVPVKVENVLNTIGVVFLFGLMIIVTIKDILFPINF